MSLKKLIDLDLLDRFLDKVKALIPSVATNAPQMDGAAAVGSSTKYAKEDHVHPTDTSLVSLDRTGTELVNDTNLNTITSPGNYYFTGTGTITNAPITTAFKMEVIRTVSGDYNNVCQIIFSFTGDSTKSQTMYYRYYASNLSPKPWSEWQSISNAATVNNHKVLSDVPTDAYFKNILERSTRENISAGTDLNDIKTAGVYYSSKIVVNSPLSSSNYAFTMFVLGGYNYGHGCSQIVFPADAEANAIFTSDVYFRRYSPNASDSGWSDWVNIRNPELVNGHTVESDVPANAFFKNILEASSRILIPDDSDLNDIVTAGTYRSSGNYSQSITNAPTSALIYESFYLYVIQGSGPYNDNGCYQIVFPSDLNPNSDVYIRRYSPYLETSVQDYDGPVWSDWMNIRNPEIVNGHTILSDVPANAVFTDTTYTPASSAPGKVASASSAGTSTNYARQDHTHGIDLATGDSNGQVKIAGQNVSVKGLKSLAYADSVTTVNGHTVYSDVPTNAFFKNLLEIGSSTAIPDGSNLNDYKTAGRYHTSNTSHGITNVPSSLTGPFSLVVADNFTSGANSCHQFLFCDPLNNGRDTFFVRSYNFGTWGDWFDIRNAATVNGHTVLSDVPANAVFTDTTYTPASNDPLMDGTAAVGTSEKYAREDHVHPRDSQVFSLMYETEIPVDSDLDTYTTPGNYFCSSATNAKKIANSPAVIAYKLVVVRIVSAARYYQIAFPNGLPNIYIRYYGGSAWTDWVNFRDANKVNGHTVESDVPENAVFTDTTYTPATAVPGNIASSSSTGTSTNYARQDHTHGITVATGDSDGQVKIAGQNASVKGLKSLAYADSVTKVNGHTVQSDVPANAFFKNLLEIGSSTTIPAGSDLNDYITAGRYHTTSGSNISNLPSTAIGAFSLVVTDHILGGAYDCYQFLFNITASRDTIYVRAYRSTSGWYNWYDICLPKIDSVNGVYYGECDTAAATAAKIVTLTNGDGFALVEGAKICVRFTNANSASNPTLDVNSTGAKPIVRYGTTAIGATAGISGSWSAGGVVLLVFDGTNWVEHYWHNNTYSSMSVTEYTNGTGTTARTITPARLKAAIVMHSAPKVYTASIPTTGWTTASAYGAYIDVTFTGATFAADDTVFVDLNLSSDTNLQAINDAWACLLRATPTASSAKIRFKFSEIPTVAIPVRAVVM